MEFLRLSNFKGQFLRFEGKTDVYYKCEMKSFSLSLSLSFSLLIPDVYPNMHYFYRGRPLRELSKTRTEFDMWWKRKKCFICEKEEARSSDFSMPFLFRIFFFPSGCWVMIIYMSSPFTFCCRSWKNKIIYINR